MSFQQCIELACTKADEAAVSASASSESAVESATSATSAAQYAANAQNSVANAVATATASATASANNSAISAAQSNAAADRAEAVVIPTTASYLTGSIDWKTTAMSKAQFNALAAERRANRAGSGFDEFGKHYGGYPNVNEGIWTGVAYSNLFKLGATSAAASSVCLSKTDYPMVAINGVNHKIGAVNTTDVAYSYITLPSAPTIYPFGTTLTAEQIASGCIKHADASNSGLIVNGKFDTDTSGWGSFDAVLSLDANRIKITSIAAASSGTFAVQTLSNLVVGKKYIVEFDVISISSGSLLFRIGSGTITQPFNHIYTTTPIVGRNSIEFTATLTTHHIFAGGATVVSGNFIYDNIAVFPADAISRSDLGFLESWHEDASEKDFVYPLGNVQYLGTTGDAGTPIAGAFAGFGTYSLFGNWQASGALVGKGYVWSTLSDANKKAFVANPENNCYLDGDKVIQARYRVRVVDGPSDSWGSIDPQLNGYLIRYSGSAIKPKGKLASNSDYGSVDTLGLYGNKYTTWNNVLTWNDNGVYTASSSNGSTTGFLAGSYNGQCFAMPIALIHRRNQGGYNATYNPNGTKTMTMTPANISDCFNPANYTATTGYIGTSTSRPDGLFYDQVSVEDFKPANKGADLRNSSKKRTAQNIIEGFAPKVLAGTIPYYNNDTTALTTYKDAMEVRTTGGDRYPIQNKIGNVVTIGSSVANKKGFTVVTQNGKQYLQVADDVAADSSVQLNLSTIKYDIGVFDA